MFCSNCGQLNKDNATECKRCGLKFEEENLNNDINSSDFNANDKSSVDSLDNSEASLKAGTKDKVPFSIIGIISAVFPFIGAIILAVFSQKAYRHEKKLKIILFLSSVVYFIVSVVIIAVLWNDIANYLSGYSCYIY